MCRAALQISIATLLVCRAALRISIATLLICRAALRISIATLLICRAALRIAMAIVHTCRPTCQTCEYYIIQTTELLLTYTVIWNAHKCSKYSSVCSPLNWRLITRVHTHTSYRGLGPIREGGDQGRGSGGGARGHVPP